MLLLLKNDLLSRWFFLLAAILIFLLKAIGVENVGTIVALFIVVVLISNRECIYNCNNDVVFCYFIVVCVTSGIFYVFNDRPFSVYLQGICYNLIPSLTFLIGSKDAINNDEHSLNRMLVGAMFLMCVGLFFYFFATDFYYSRLGDSLDKYRWGAYDYRYGSLISSLNLGSLCVASICLLLATFCYRNVFFNTAFALVIFISVFLCMERSAWMATAAGLFLITMFSKMGKSKKMLIGTFVVMILALGILNSDRIFSDAQLDYFTKRFSGADSAKMIGERSGQWLQALDIFKDFPLGYGLGSMGHKAAEAGFSRVAADGNYFRILSEIGIFGLASFIVLVYRGVMNAIKQKIELAVFILCFCFQAVGSNVFDLFYSSCFFWYVLGYTNHLNKDRAFILK